MHQHEIGAVLEPLDLALRLDSHRGVAFLAVTPASQESSGNEDGWAHPLVRRQRLTLEQSLLVALLRQAFVMHEQESGVGQGAAIVAIDELLPQFMAYIGDSGSDAKNESRMLSLLDQLKTYGIVSEIDKKQEVTVRPLIAHLANPESLAALLALLKDQRQDVEAAGAKGNVRSPVAIVPEEVDVATRDTSYLLQQLEVYNWGPFRGLHRAVFDPNGTAIIGPTGSGKTTLVDALMTLLVAQPRYNLASTGGHESDRTLISYVRGVLGGDGSDGREEVSRPGKTITAVCATYRGGEQTVRLAGLLWTEAPAMPPMT